MRSDRRLKEESEPEEAATETAAPPAPTSRSAVSQLLGLQRTAGNGAVGRMLAARNNTLARTPPTEAPPGPAPAPGPGIQVIPTPTAKNPLVRHTPTNIDFSEDKEFVKHQLETFADKHGVDAIDRFDKLPGTWMPAEANPLAPPEQQAKPDDQYIDRVRALVHEECVTLRAHISQFLSDFERHAHTTLMTALTDSEVRVKSELERLGIKSEEHLWGLYSSHSGADNDAGKKMAAGAKALLDKFDEVKGNSTLPHVVDSPPMFGEERKPADEERRTKAKGEWQTASDHLDKLKREYNEMRHAFEAANPMAIGYQLDLGSGTTRENLVKLADDNAKNRADKMGGDLKEKLDNIQKVRKYAEDWKYIWRLEKIVDVTLERPEIKGYKELTSDGVRRSAVYDKAGANKATDEMTNMGVGIVMFALGLIAAAPTGGLSMAGQAAVTAAGGAELITSIGVAVTSAERYRMESAESGTDYDKAKVVADRDPSLIWLGLDILGALGSIAGAVAKGREVFGELLALRKEAMNAKEATAAKEAAGLTEGGVKEADAAAQRLRTEGNKAAPGAGDRLVKEVESGPSRQSGVAAEEAGSKSATGEAELAAAKSDAAALAGEFQTVTPLTRTEAREAYFAAIKANPNVEHAVIQHTVAQDMWVYIEGKAGEVVTPAFLKKNWSFDRHFHPKGAKFPSIGAEVPAAGATLAADADIVAKNLRKTELKVGGDLGAAKQEALRTGQPVTETIDWMDPATGHMQETSFGFDPSKERPIWFEIKGEGIRGDYKSLKEAEVGIGLLLPE